MEKNVINLLETLPKDVTNEEIFEEIAKGGKFSLKRIISTGQTSEWYDQKEHEVCFVLSGSAKLQFDEDSREIVLKTGDYIEIPAHCKHRVSETENPTVWLALYYSK